MSRHSHDVEGLRLLSINFVATSVGISIFLMRALFPFKIDVLLSNGLYCVSNILLYVGVAKLVKFRPRVLAPIQIAILSTMALACFRQNDQIVIRIVIITMTDFGLRAFLFSGLLNGGRRNGLATMLATFTGLFLVGDVLRTAATLVYGGPAGVFAYDLTQVSYIALTFLINCGVGVFAIALAGREVAASIERWSHLDPLTGALNRRGIERLLGTEIERSRRTGTSCSVAILDIDDFKRFNDTGGHALGDAVLRKIAECINHNLRSYDALGRFGGDEFILLLPGADPNDGVDLCKRIVRAIETLPPYSAAGFSPTVSMGLTVMDASDTSEKILERADRGLYAAKRLGKNRVGTEVLAGMAFPAP
jgi:diguanylate cyclase (GGDEF)-like protein